MKVKDTLLGRKTVTNLDSVLKNRDITLPIKVCKVAAMVFREGFPHSSVHKESACNAGDSGSILGSGRSPGERNGNSLHYSCLENPMDRGAWWATVVTNIQSDTTERLSHKK